MSKPIDPNSLDSSVLRLALAGKTRNEMATELKRELRSIHSAVNRLRGAGRLDMEVPYGEGGKVESLTGKVLRLALAGKSRQEIIIATEQPPHNINRELSRLRKAGKLKVEVPNLPHIKVAGFRTATNPGMKVAITERPRHGGKHKVTAEEQAAMAEFIALCGVRILPTRYADGATPDPDQYHQFRNVAVAA